VIDPDSDNDGIPDGKDNWPCEKNKQRYYIITPFIGLWITDDDLPIKNNFEYGLRLAYPINPVWDVEADGGIVLTKDDLNNSGNIIQLNLNLIRKFNIGTSPKFDPYTTAGFGVLLYRGFSSDQNSSAINFGGGFNSKLTNQLTLRLDNSLFVGTKIYTMRKLNFNYQASLGIIFKLP